MIIICTDPIVSGQRLDFFIFYRRHHVDKISSIRFNKVRNFWYAQLDLVQCYVWIGTSHPQNSN